MKKTLHLIKMIVLDPISENLKKTLSKHESFCKVKVNLLVAENHCLM